MKKNTLLYIKITGLYLIFLFGSPVTLRAQTNYYFYVQFTDKNNSPFSLSRPVEFLSARAVARRNAFALTCDSTDLPVNATYLQQIRNLGIPVHNWSKWMNGATVLLPDFRIIPGIFSECQ